MHSYFSYGLHIQSELAMPELSPGSGAVDVSVRFARLERPRPEEMESYYLVRETPEGIFYFMEHIGSVWIRDGREILIDPLPGAEERGFRFLVSGIAMGLLLHQRGFLTLHASSVAVGDGAVAFTGWKGMGKSTLAASLHARGHAIITDDLLVLSVEPDGVQVVPGFPTLKLFPDSAAASLGDDPEALPRIDVKGEKRSRATHAGFRQAALPLKAIYVLDYLDEGTEHAIEPLPPRQACVELVRHSFALRLLQKQGVSAAHLRQCSQVVEQVPVSRLWRVRSLDGLAGLATLIETDLGFQTPEPVQELAAAAS